MPKYLVLYKAESSGVLEQCSEPTPDERQAMMRAWFDWRDAAADSIVDFGAPTMEVRQGGGSTIGGYSVVRAASPAGLDAVFETNPHRLQGGILEFHEIVEMPDA